MIDFLAFVDTSDTSRLYIDGAISIMSDANSLGARIYPLIATFGLIRAIFNYV